jgi:hypothetical protein
MCTIKLWVSVAGFLVLAGCSSSDKSATTQSTQASSTVKSQALIATVKALEAAHNRHDIEAELCLYADDIRFEAVDAWTKEGKAELRKLIELDAMLNSRMDFTGFSVADNRVTCKVKEQNDMIQLLGMGLMSYEDVFTFRDGLIRQVRATVSAESLQDEERQFGLFEQWASVNRPKELAEWKASNPAELNKEKITQWLVLLREWHKATDNAGPAKP